MKKTVVPLILGVLTFAMLVTPVSAIADTEEDGFPAEMEASVGVSVAATSGAAAPAEVEERDGASGAVNNATTLEDGEYPPDKFSWSGGSGRVRITCSKVTVSGGKAIATIGFSSPNYAYVKADGRMYYPSVSDGCSWFTIPVELNSNNRIIGMTTAMTAPHEVTYTIYVYLEDAQRTAEDSEEAKAAEITGLRYKSSDPIENSRLYKIDRYEDGCTAIDVAEVGKFLVVPEGTELPVGVDGEAVVIRQPVSSVYVGSEHALMLIDGMDLEDSPVKTVGVENFNFEKMDAETLVYAGGFDAPDYAALLKAGCDLAILPDDLAEVRQRLDLLGIPMFVDRSAEEETEAARLEWVRAFGILTGCEEEANAYYEAAFAALEEGK